MVKAFQCAGRQVLEELIILHLDLWARGDGALHWTYLERMRQQHLPPQWPTSSNKAVPTNSATLHGPSIQTHESMGEHTYSNHDTLEAHRIVKWIATQQVGKLLFQRSWPIF